MGTTNEPELPGLEALVGRQYCLRCKVGALEDADLCRLCGDRLVPQGYCPVCETTWCLPVGAACPKHDVELEAAAASQSRKPIGAAEVSPLPRWVTVAVIGDDTQAEALRLRLEAEGIPTFLEGARMGSRSMYTVATGGVKLQVPEPLRADARVLLAQVCVPLANPEDDLEDAWDELRPAPWVARRQVMKVVLLVILLGPIGIGVLMFLLALINAV